MHDPQNRHPLGQAFCLLAAVAGLSAGCAKPHAAASNLRLTEQEQSQRYVLDEQQRQELRTVMGVLAMDHQPVDPPTAAESGVRWADVPLAVFYASADVEMAVVRTIRADDRITFHLRTAHERPARLIVWKLDDDRVYDASATCGLMENDEQIANALLKALHARMRAFGAKRAF